MTKSVAFREDDVTRPLTARELDAARRAQAKRCADAQTCLCGNCEGVPERAPTRAEIDDVLRARMRGMSLPRLLTHYAKLTGRSDAARSEGRYVLDELEDRVVAKQAKEDYDIGLSAAILGTQRVLTEWDASVLTPAGIKCAIVERAEDATVAESSGVANYLPLRDMLVSQLAKLESIQLGRKRDDNFSKVGFQFANDDRQR